MQLADWQARRERLHFLGNNQEIADYAAACGFIRERQVVLPWVTTANPALPLPSLRAAYKHPVQREPGPIWDWKDRLPIDKLAFYGSLARKCRVLISPELLPAFYRASGRTGDPEDYQIDYAEGQLSYLGKQVMDALTAGSCSTKDLRQRLRSKGVDISRLSSGLDELRERFYVTHVGVMAEGRGYGLVWGLVDRQWSEAVAEALLGSRADARQAVLAALLHAAVLASRTELRRMTGWSESAFDAALGRLLDSGEVQPVAGSDLLVCSRQSGLPEGSQAGNEPVLQA